MTAGVAQAHGEARVDDVGSRCHRSYRRAATT